jgi:hypothetical protein
VWFACWTVSLIPVLVEPDITEKTRCLVRNVQITGCKCSCIVRLFIPYQLECIVDKKSLVITPLASLSASTYTAQLQFTPDILVIPRCSLGAWTIDDSSSRKAIRPPKFPMMARPNRRVDFVTPTTFTTTRPTEGLLRSKALKATVQFTVRSPFHLAVVHNHPSGRPKRRTHSLKDRSDRRRVPKLVARAMAPTTPVAC